MGRRPSDPVELVVLRGSLRAWKGRLTFQALERGTSACGGQRVSACTLRRALDGRLPTRRTVVAFAAGAARARGAGRDEERRAKRDAAVLWQAASDAIARQQAVRPPPAHVPGRVITRAGLARAMVRVRAAAGGPSLRALVAAPEAEGRLTRSALHNALKERRLPSKELLVAFAAACRAGEETTKALLAARTRLVPTGVQTREEWYPCAVVERADLRRQRDEAARPWLVEREADRDWYDRQLADEEEAELQRQVDWVDSLSSDELEELQAHSAAAAGNLHAEWKALVRRYGGPDL
ncbi:hypothetical protein ACIRJS_27300 [Streptomyces sp. NPDC102340]|uniref:hypothetical protein n=1 Tax=unclassified Streptomyces TaxID=2593676 RepID=UPI00381583A6